MSKFDKFDKFFSKRNADVSPGRNQLKGELGDKTPEWKKKYSVEHHTYPENLFDPQKPLGAYVVFYINVFDASKIVSNKKTEFVQDNDEIQKQRRNGVIKKIATSKNAMRAGVVGASTGIVGAIGGVLGKGEIPNLKEAGKGAALGAAAAGFGLGMLETQDIKLTKSQKRLKQAIAMHMPNEMSIAYSSKYESENMMDAALAVKLGETGVSIATKIAEGVKENAGKLLLGAAAGGPVGLAATIGATAAKGVYNNIDGITSELKSYGAPLAALSLNTLPFGKAISAASGVAVNPKTQMVFEGVAPRSFEMSYNLFAHSETELENIHRIINTFKMNMLPEYKDNEEFLFVYPAEFDIEYYFGAEQNKYIHRVTSCVLTDCRINYTPDGVFNHFNKNGAPLRIQMTLTFTELDILTRDDINPDGGGY